MKKLMKVMIALSCVGTCLFAINQVEAAVIYNQTAESNTHFNGNASQFYRIDAEMKLVGSSATMNSYSDKWYRSGDAYFDHTPMKYATGSSQYTFESISAITPYNGVKVQKKLYAYVKR